MAYHVIKTVKGKRYLYSQESYREEGKVKTKSQYIGAIDSDGVILTEQEERQAIGKQTRKQLNQALTQKKAVTAKPNKSTQTQDKTLSRQNPTFSLSPIIKISENALRSEYKRLANRLKHYGIDPVKFPTITVKHGSETKHYKPAFKDGLIVTTPKRGMKPNGTETYAKECSHLKTTSSTFPFI